MAIITRPIKTGGGTDVVAGNDVLAQEWNGDLNTIYDDHNGKISDANCDTNMGLQGTKLADAPLGVPTAKINDKAVTSTKLSSDASNDAIRAVTKDHIKNLNVPLNKLAAVLQVKTTLALVNTSIFPPNIVIAQAIRKIVGANYEFDVFYTYPLAAGNSAFGSLSVTPTTPIPVATKEIVAVYFANFVFGASVSNIDLYILSIDKT